MPTTTTMKRLKVNPEFEKLIPPLSPDELNLLEESCLKHGIRDKIITWNGEVLDGHNRFAISQKHDLDFETLEIDFCDALEAKVWIIKNQLSRRNLPPYERVRLNLVLEDVLKQQGRANQLSTLKQNTVFQNSGKRVIEETPLQHAAKLMVPFEKINTEREIAKLSNVSHDTVHKVKKIEEKATEEQKEKLRTGEASINSVYQTIKVEERKQSVNGDNENNAYNPTDPNHRRVVIYLPPLYYRFFMGYINYNEDISESSGGFYIFKQFFDSLTEKERQKYLSCSKVA